MIFCQAEEYVQVQPSHILPKNAGHDHEWINPLKKAEGLCHEQEMNSLNKRPSKN